VALCQARTSTKPLWGLTSSNPYHSQSRAEQLLIFPLTWRTISKAAALIPYLGVDPPFMSTETKLKSW
jgi:hypothetical protein